MKLPSARGPRSAAVVAALQGRPGTSIDHAVFETAVDNALSDARLWRKRSTGRCGSRTGIDEFQEFIAQRSVYHLREADPHTFGIPRLAGRSKAAPVEIQSDEYGGGIPGLMHAELFAQLMNPTARCDPSQNGLRADRPHRHNATVRRPQSTGSPSGPTISNEPRTINGPSSYGLIDAPTGLRNPGGRRRYYVVRDRKNFLRRRW